jgi:hypothetical protein
MRHLSKIKLWSFLIKKFFAKLYYNTRYGIEFDNANTRGSVLPSVGENEFVNIKQKGVYLDIENKKTGRMIRMIPSKHSLGYMIEFSKEGEIIYRGQMSFNDIWKHYIGE